jgi:creatinine amidohydrolase/Fe(II)-dependent formamide hydrolase-like protein
MTALAPADQTWPEVRDEIARGRDTVVMALGAFEQHGPHLPLVTDAVLGDHLAWAVADRLDAFVAPTLTVGCSQGEREFGVPVGDGGLHGGDWETSMLLTARPDLVREERYEAGFTGDPRDALERVLRGGVGAVSSNGVLGDPDRASAAKGRRYRSTWVRIVLDHVARPDAG